MRAIPVLVVVACCLSACGEDSTDPPATTTSEGGGGSEGGGPDGCPPGNVTEADGSCEPAGTPADQCGEGFAATGDQSCEPILPTLPCPLGTMAVPGDDSCQPIADCGTGTWGVIETGPNTQHVDDSYTLGDSDGTAAKPWPTVTAAMAAAAPGATVAVAEGDYPAALVVDKPITLWGRCPDLVTLGANTNVAVTLGPAAGGTTLRGVTIGPAATGVFSDGATAITLRELRVRQPATVGIALSDASGPATAAVERVAIEEVAGIALRMTGQTEVTAEALYTVAEPTVENTGGIRMFASPTHRADLVLHRSTLIGHRYTAVHVAGADAELESVAILPGAAEDLGQYGLQVIDHEEQLGTLTLRDSLVSGRRRFALMARGGQVAIERTLFRNARLYCEPALYGSNLPGTMSLDRSVVETVTGPYAIQGWACDLTVTGSVLRDVAPDPAEVAGGLGLIFGEAFFLTEILDWMHGGSVEVTDSVVSQTHEVGILLVSGSGSVSHTRVVGTLPREGGLYGDGLSALGLLDPGSLTVRDSGVEDNARAGIGNFSAEVVVGDTSLRCNAFAFAGQSPWNAEFSFVDEGGNRCGCDDQQEECKVLAPNLDPPQPPIDG